MSLSVSEQLSYSTVRIECELSDGSLSTGTGFFFLFLQDKTTNKHVPVVITNKHVINGATTGRLIMNKADKNGLPLDKEHFPIYFNNFENLWRKHPDSDVDLCAMPMAYFLNEAIKQGEQLFYIPLEMSLIPTQEELETFSALEEILMVGYPNGIWDNVNNKPIFRKGITATHPFKDYCGKKEFMIDAACFPGSSGSPVFIFNEGTYRDNKTNTVNVGTRIKLLGALYAGPQYTITGQIVMQNISISQVPISVSNIPNNLGLVIKSERIVELEKLNV